MRLSAFFIALFAVPVAHAAATRQVTQNDTCVTKGNNCVVDDVSAPCCYGLQCKPFKFRIETGGGHGPEVIVTVRQLCFSLTDVLGLPVTSHCFRSAWEVAQGKVHVEVGLGSTSQHF